MDTKFLPVGADIQRIRFPMTVAVVMLHTYCILTGAGVRCHSLLSYSLSLMIGELGVPAFFTLSGLLFFRFSGSFAQAYKRKLRSRVTTLLVPYLLWNAIFAAVLAVTGKHSFHTVADVLRTFVDKGDWSGGNGTPALPAFWYIRNLMALCLCSPLIYWLLQRLRFVLPALLFAWWIMTPGLAFMQISMLFFTLGGAL